MPQTIILKDSPNYKHYLKELIVVKSTASNCHSGKAYRLFTNDFAGIRYSTTDNRKHTIMLAGGPRITEGDILKNEPYKVKDIIRLNPTESSKYYTFVFILEQVKKDA